MPFLLPPTPPMLPPAPAPSPAHQHITVQLPGAAGHVEQCGAAHSVVRLTASHLKPQALQQIHVPGFEPRVIRQRLFGGSSQQVLLEGYSQCQLHQAVAQAGGGGSL